MTFEIKKMDVIGGIKAKDSATSSQNISVKIGIVGCPYADIVTNKMIEYVFPNTLSYQEIKDGMTTFANTWLTANYPNV